MRRFASILVLAAVLPLAAAIPASRVKEPNAVFTYKVSPDEGRLQATLFDRAKRVALDQLDARVDDGTWIASGGSVEGNDTVQFSAATGKIYYVSRNYDGYAGRGRINGNLPYDAAIIETDFGFKQRRVVYSCANACVIGQWIIHPTKPALYVSVPDPLRNGDEFRAAKLAEISLEPKLRTRVISRVPARAALRVTADGSSIYTFAEAYGSSPPYGAVVTVNLRTRRRSQQVANFPRTNDLGNPMSPGSSDVSPDAREVAYHFGVVDLRTDEVETLMEGSPYELDNYAIGWSRDSSRLLFQLMEGVAAPADRDEVPLLYDRPTKREWVLPIQDARLLDWSPAQTAILFDKRGDVGFYDLEKREWVFVAEGEEGSWVTLPTKRVPKR